ncbi:hypothetical protein L3Q82_012351, partial [Scortum barcoo]
MTTTWPTEEEEEVEQLVIWCEVNNLILNVDKTKEGVHITDDLTWSVNSASLVKRAQLHLHFLRGYLWTLALDPRCSHKPSWTEPVEALASICCGPSSWLLPEIYGEEKHEVEKTETQGTLTNSDEHNVYLPSTKLQASYIKQFEICEQREFSVVSGPPAVYICRITGGNP